MLETAKHIDRLASKASRTPWRKAVNRLRIEEDLPPLILNSEAPVALFGVNNVHAPNAEANLRYVLALVNAWPNISKRLRELEARCEELSTSASFRKG